MRGWMLVLLALCGLLAVVYYAGFSLPRLHASERSGRCYKPYCVSCCP
jgi:hypothetical protein